MKKYWQILKLTIEEYLVYRLNFILWRFRSFIFLLSLLFFWLAIYGGRGELLGYQRAQMLTYVVGIAFLRSFVLASRSVDLTGQIRTGELTKIVLSPLNIFSYWITRDLADKLLNILFTTAEIGIVLLVFKIPFYIPQNLFSAVSFFVLLILAILLYFFISMALAMTAFWTEEVWATRWLFGIIFLEFFAGAFFPIDVLPPFLARIIYLTPFPYLVFFPIKAWLEQLSFGMIFKSIIICSGWLVFFSWLSRYLWQKGAKNYGAYGG